MTTLIKLTTSFILILSFSLGFSQESGQKTSPLVNPPEKMEFLDGFQSVLSAFQSGKKLEMNKDLPVLKYAHTGQELESSDFVRMTASSEFVPVTFIHPETGQLAMVLFEASEEDKKMLKAHQEQREKKESPISSKWLGHPAPEFSAQLITGEDISLQSLQGKVIVVNFWFIECPPCKAEMPDLNALVEKYKDENVVFVGFALNDVEAIESFLTEKPFNYQHVANSKPVGKLFEVSSFPTNLVIDQDGKVTYASSGFMPGIGEEISEVLDHLLEK
ncbi:MAG: TlpA family protein disulfide reductase [Saprospiraceae bacterium]|nr:TlpA family protein disulfide reductase [Saprospiraceae bacterium]